MSDYRNRRSSVDFTHTNEWFVRDIHGARTLGKVTAGTHEEALALARAACGPRVIVLRAWEKKR